MHASTFFVATVAALASLAAATPPACLLAAVMDQPNPADLKALCGSLESAMAGNITEKCIGSNEVAAVSAYSSTCLAQGVTVTVSIPIATGTGGSSTVTGGVDSPGSTSTSTGASASSTKNAAPSMHALQSTSVLASIFLGIAYLL